MSAIPIYEHTRGATITVGARSAAVAGTAGKKVRRRSLSLVSVIGHSSGFVIIAGFACFCASLAGNVMVEKARREGIEALEKARIAARANAALRDEVQGLTSASAIAEWARTNGFVAASSAPVASAQGNLVSQQY